ncbi:MAG: carboxylating nicotinate-nucleotide diphosphorylase [Candidatus Omnitrophica bacterium]|nr:carboxylating nicotinate-nucleotide diphosphorylase [Candidatus Omnitrophota bacterium]
MIARSDVLPLIRAALREDAAAHDITSRATIPASRRIRARIIAKASGILAGGPIAVWTFQAADPTLRCRLQAKEGARLAKGQTILTVEGKARSIFAAERTALNVLGHLSGIATLTRAFVDRVNGTQAKILDTRKTLPGLRALEKHAVRAGGGQSHRASLADALLIKTNHLRTATHDTRHKTHDLQSLVQNVKKRYPHQPIEIEVVDLREFDSAFATRPDIILLDNWSNSHIRLAVLRRNTSCVMGHGSWVALEVSGGVTLQNVRAIAATGVDRISIGRLTHSAPSLDLSLQVVYCGITPIMKR